QPKRLFLIDAMAMAFRSYYAFGMRQLTTSAGHPTSAVFGTVMFMTKLLNEQKPDYLAICCDAADKTFRHALYPEYKANRSEMPTELALQMGDFIRCLSCF